MKFFQTIKASVYGPDFYASHEERTLGNAWGYYTKLSVLAALVLAVVLSLVTIPPLNVFLARIPAEAAKIYPPELVLTFENNTVRSNVQEPYFIDVPEEWKHAMPENERSKWQHLIVIDTANEYSNDLYQQYRPGAWLFHDGIAIADQNGVKIQKFADMKDRNGAPLRFTLDKAVVQRFFDALSPVFQFVPAILVTGIFLGLLFLYGLSIAVLAFIALFVLLLGRILKKEWDYPTSLKLSFYAATLPFLLYHILILMFYPPGLLLFAAIILAVLVVNFGWDRSSAPEPPKTPPAPEPTDTKDTEKHE